MLHYEWPVTVADELRNAKFSRGGAVGRNLKLETEWIVAITRHIQAAASCVGRPLVPSVPVLF